MSWSESRFRKWLKVKKQGDTLGKVIKALNALIYQATGRKTRLGWIALGALGALGIQQTILYGLRLESVPGPVLLLAACELYRRQDQMKPDV